MRALGPRPPRYPQIPGDAGEEHQLRLGLVPPPPLKAHHVAALLARVRRRRPDCACVLRSRGDLGSEKKSWERKGRLLREGGLGRSQLPMQILASRVGWGRGFRCKARSAFGNARGRAPQPSASFWESLTSPTSRLKPVAQAQ